MPSYGVFFQHNIVARAINFRLEYVDISSTSNSKVAQQRAKEKVFDEFLAMDGTTEVVFVGSGHIAVP